MATSQQIIERRIELPNLVAGQRVRLDADLQDESGAVLAPNKVIVMTPGCAFVSEQTILGVPTIDIENFSNETQTLVCLIQFDHSIQLDADQVAQVTVGTGGAQPSPTAALGRDFYVSDTPIFESAVTLATGVAQNIPHGLGAVPRAVLVSPYQGDDGMGAAGLNAPLIAEGAHDATNVVVTVTQGASFKILAFL